MARTKVVKSKIRRVKVLHFLITVCWPVAVVLAALGDGYLFVSFRQSYTPAYHPAAMLLFFFWLFFVYYVMVIMRNFNLQTIATQECDFDAYLECVRYLGKFQPARIKRGQRINLIDAYLIKGDFDTVYENLMLMKDQYVYLNDRIKMMYDYFWCRFYADLEDIPNFHICMEVFRNNWIYSTYKKRRLQAQAMSLLEGLNFREMLFMGKNDRLKAEMMNLYAAGKLSSRYEFVRYCYYMGRIEYNMNNLEIAKHWFAQTVSFGLQEYMSKRSADFLAMLDNMRVPYAAVPPAQNQYYCNSRNFSMAAGIIMILLGLLLVLMLM